MSSLIPRATFAPRTPRAANTHAPVIESRDFVFSYGEAPTLKGITIQIPRNAVTAIIGPSGCGKSTFLRSINRLNELIPGTSWSGDIQLDGKSVYAPGTDAVALRQRIGMVFQRPNPFPKSIYDNVAYGPTLNALVAKRDLPDLVERCLRRAALWEEVKDRLDEAATGLSGGQQQRLCIARALATEPDVLLMDEPASALDPIATAAIEDLMHDLKREYTIIVVTHNMQQAARVADMTAFFSVEVHEDGKGRNGILVEYDATTKIFTQPADKRTEDYVTGRFG